MNAVAVSRLIEQDHEVREGVIDLFSGTWTCVEHNLTLKVGRECAFCAVDKHGVEVLDALAF